MNRTLDQTKQSVSGDEAGFTLLETAISMVLLAIVGLGIASVFFYAAKNNSSARDRELAMAVAQQQMEQLRNVSFKDSSLARTVTVVTPTAITRAGRLYTVQTTIMDSNFVNGTATTKRIIVRVTPWSDGSSWARNVSSVFGSVTMISERSAQTIGPNRDL